MYNKNIGTVYQQLVNAVCNVQYECWYCIALPGVLTNVVPTPLFKSSRGVVMPSGPLVTPWRTTVIVADCVHKSRADTNQLESTAPNPRIWAKFGPQNFGKIQKNHFPSILFDETS